MRLYLDVCCLGRLDDDPGQARISLEADAIELIFQRIAANQWEWISSEAIDIEIGHNPNPERRSRARMLVADCHHKVAVGVAEAERAAQLVTLGFGAMDGVHLACAESGGAQVFLTTDDRLLRLARRLRSALKVRVENPITWLRQVIP
jgi:predicted nucleic acid-binding protein